MPHQAEEDSDDCSGEGRLWREPLGFVWRRARTCRAFPFRSTLRRPWL